MAEINYIRSRRRTSARTQCVMLKDLEPVLKIFYTFACKKVPGKIADKYMEKLKQASREI